MLLSLGLIPAIGQYLFRMRVVETWNSKPASESRLWLRVETHPMKDLVICLASLISAAELDKNKSESWRPLLNPYKRLVGPVIAKSDQILTLLMLFIFHRLFAYCLLDNWLSPISYNKLYLNFSPFGYKEEYFPTCHTRYDWYEN